MSEILACFTFCFV